MPHLPYFLERIRTRLRKFRAAALFWRMLKKLGYLPYYIIRAFSYIGHPFLGTRGPLLGYNEARDAVRQFEGTYVSLVQSPESINFIRTDAVTPEMFVAVIPRGRLLYDCGAVVLPDHKLLADASWTGYGPFNQPRYHSAMYKFRLPPLRTIPARVAVLSSIEHSNYYHWLLDILPRFQTLNRAAIAPDYYFVNTEMQFQSDTLQIMNIPLDKIVNPTKHTYLEARELIIPSLTGPVFDLTPQPRSCEYLRSIFLKAEVDQKGHRALYITRTDATSRRVVNESDICDEAVRRGFEIVSLTGMPFVQQVKLFSEARIVVGPHGAGLTNAVFCQPGSVLIEFMPETYYVPCFERLSKCVGLQYHAIIGTRSRSSGKHDQIINIEALCELLDKVAPTEI